MDINLLKIILKDQIEQLLSKDPEELNRLLDIEASLKKQEITVITGIRRCGKSTVLRQIARSIKHKNNIHYINFEDHRLKKFTFEDFELAYNEFLINADSKNKKILLYDEIQNIKEWESWVSSFSQDRDVKIFITGSNAKMLSTELSTLLTGRYEQKFITPFSYREILPKSLRELDLKESLTSKISLQFKQIYRLFQTYGGFPKSYLTKDTEILRQYYDDIVLKDIAVRKKIRNVSALYELGSVLASQNTRLFNKRKVAKDLGIKDSNTITKFCNYFKETFLYSELRCFSRSRRQQLRSASKFYSADPLMAKMAGYHEGNVNYWILENLVFNELSRRYKDIWYWHSKDKLEVDFIVRLKTGEYHAYQVSESILSEDTKNREIRAIFAAFKEIKISNAFIITESEIETIKQEKHLIEVLPFYIWALQ